ncbi:hypothetical protein [Phenylobacterium sp.]|jgi:hypothetical protein|uniref:hypothetical protein n=1 Tax=Phenylobacterium sp. TaxID=1871053 RepID=UPI002F428E27
MGQQTPSGQGKDSKDLHPGMMGDGTEEQNLNQKGDPSARITEGEVKDAFEDAGKDGGGKSKH